ncbi:RCC1-like domain-containing protein [Streptomyces fagopyri]|uniref:RCC1-like domain-containing protein n=1 Tax=Streptomyces fagopyri TaxID=2662397 RepID=UPI003724269A
MGLNHSLALREDGTVWARGLQHQQPARRRHHQLPDHPGRDLGADGLPAARNTPWPGSATTRFAPEQQRLRQLGNGTTADSSTPMTTLTALTGADETAAPVGGDSASPTKTCGPTGPAGQLEPEEMPQA